jgi:cytochrome c biogenesis protein CcmG/thiol:disulfide interchange protein DsbE
MHARVEVINVWASWCYPCRRETRRLDALHRQAGPDVLFLGIDVKDSAAHARAFLAHQGVGYPQATDPDGRFAHALHLFGVPSTLVVDASGQVRWRHDGQLGPADASTLMAQVRSALSAGRLTDGGRATPSAR